MSEMHVAHEAVTLERLEVAVHRGGVHSQTVGEVLGRHWTIGREQRLEHEASGGDEPQAPLA